VSIGPSRYTFGDTSPAGRRLDLLAELFAPTTAAFLRRDAPLRPGLAVDLGCGPGHTTRLVAMSTGAARTVGLDTSEAFLRAASAGPAAPGLEFIPHDITRTPIPPGPPDLLFGRYVLSHLPDPAGTVARWAAELAPDGRLLLEENVGIETSEEAIATYLDLAATRMAAAGGDLYVGRFLMRFEGRTVTFSPPVASAVTIFELNLSAWGDAAASAAVQPGLARLRSNQRTGLVTWRLRQAVIRASRGDGIGAALQGFQ
jgi:SAM-dependent methyltransferase